jgi:hypothetical protein
MTQTGKTGDRKIRIPGGAAPPGQVLASGSSG